MNYTCWLCGLIHTIIKMAAAGRRNILTLDDRVDVLKRIDNGKSCRSIVEAGSARSAEFVVTGLRF